MTIDQYRRKLEKLYNKAPNDYYKAVKSQQNNQYGLALELTGQLQTNEDGQIISSPQNLGLIEQIVSSLKASFYDTDYVDAVDNLVNTFDKSAELNDEWFKGEFGLDNLTNMNQPARMMNQVTKRQTTDLLIGTSAIDSNFFNPIKETLITGVTSGQRISELNKSIRGVIKGSKEYDGRLLRYSKQIAADSVTTADRAYSDNLAKSMDVEFYKYTGGILDDDSRCFCVLRNGNFYHKKEIENWGQNIDLGDCRTKNGWSGRYRGTDKNTIFTWLGGYNCKHSLIPVSEAAVPQDVLLEAMLKGYYKPSEETQKDLGLLKPADKKRQPDLTNKSAYKPQKQGFEVIDGLEPVETTLKEFEKAGHPINFERLYDGYHHISPVLNAKVTNPRPNEISYTVATSGFRVTRSFYINEKKELLVDRELFRITDFQGDAGGKGMGSFVMETEFDYYKKLGVKRASQTAALERGAYAWAKYGIKTDDLEYADEILGALADFGDISQYEKNKLQAYIRQEVADNGYYYPNVIAQLNGQTGLDAVKNAMFDTNYSGWFDIDDDLQMAELYSYIAERKKKYYEFLESGDW